MWEFIAQVAVVLIMLIVLLGYPYAILDRGFALLETQPSGLLWGALLVVILSWKKVAGEFIGQQPQSEPNLWLILAMAWLTLVMFLLLIALVLRLTEWILCRFNDNETR